MAFIQPRRFEGKVRGVSHHGQEIALHPQAEYIYADSSSFETFPLHSRGGPYIWHKARMARGDSVSVGSSRSSGLNLLSKLRVGGKLTPQGGGADRKGAAETTEEFIKGRRALGGRLRWREVPSLSAAKTRGTATIFCKVAEAPTSFPRLAICSMQSASNRAPIPIGWIHLECRDIDILCSKLLCISATLRFLMRPRRILKDVSEA